MGNRLIDGIKYYLGYGETDEIKTPEELKTIIDHEQKLEHEIEKLRNQLDRNNDNVVTKDELFSYFDELGEMIDLNNNNQIDMNEIKQYINDQIKSQIEETEQWKEAYEILHDKYEDLLETVITDHQPELRESNISPKALKQYIENEILNDADANMRLVPDKLERKIYLTVYKTIMKSLQGIFNTTSVDLLNHRVSFVIQPIPEEERNN